MSFAFSSLTAYGGGVTGGFPFDLSSVSLTTGVTYFIWADVEYSTGPAPTPIITASTGETSDGGTITIVDDGTRTADQLWATSDVKRVTCWQFIPTSTASRVFTFSTPSGTGVARRAGVVEVTGTHATPVEQCQVAEVTASATVTVTLPVTVQSDSATLYIGAHRQTGTPTLGSGLTNLAQVTNSAGQAKLGYSLTAIQAPETTFSASGQGAGIAIEIAAPAAAVDVVVPVDLDTVIEPEDIPEDTTDPTDPVVADPPTSVEVIPNPDVTQQSVGARPNRAREMDLARILADFARRGDTLQGQVVANQGYLPHVDEDPEAQDGLAWIRSDTGELCWRSNGVVHRLAPPEGA